jgi:hypothetical protein
MTNTAITYGSDFSEAVRGDGMLGYINNGEYSDEQQELLATALLDALREEVDERLPGDATWLPATSEFLVDIDEVDALPDREDMGELFAQAWAAVEARFEAIETDALA